MRRCTHPMAIGFRVAVLFGAVGCQSDSSAPVSSRPGSTVTVTAPPPGPTSAEPDTTTPDPAPSTTPPPTFESLFRRVKSGIVRIDNEGCDTAGIGTGFLIAPDLVATVAHVVGRTDRLRITSPESLVATKGRVVGVDDEHDVALVRTDASLPGYTFSLAARLPSIGTEIMALGFPLGRSLTFSRGTIDALHDRRTVDYESGPRTLSDALITAAPLNPGNSGGPWVTLSGRVVGLTESGPPYDEYGTRAQGQNAGVASANAKPYLDRWRSEPQDLTFADCKEQGPAARAVDTLRARYGALDSSDYASAYAQFDPANHSADGLARYIDQVKTSEVEALDGSDYFRVDAMHDGYSDSDPTTVDVTFRSTQEPEYGQRNERCTVWTQRYSFTSVNGLQLIHDGDAQPGTPGNRPC